MKVRRDGHVLDDAGKCIGRIGKWAEFFSIYSPELGAEQIRVDGRIAWPKQREAVDALRKHLGITWADHGAGRPTENASLDP